MPKAMGDKDRAFTVDASSFGYTGGRAVAAKPSTAGKNEGSKLFEMAASDPRFAAHRNKKVLALKIREVTQGVRDGKTFMYSVTRVPREDARPMQFPKKDGGVVSFTPENVYAVKALDEATFEAMMRR
jgi:hypothetical protein